MTVTERTTTATRSIETTGAWWTVSDQVVAGICHDLNGRISALSGLLQLAELDGNLDPVLGEQLQAEIGRLEQLVRLLRVLPRGRGNATEPARLGDIVDTAIALMRRHRGLEFTRVMIEHRADPLIHVEWDALVKAVLMMLVAATRHGADGGPAPIGVCVMENAATAVLLIEAAEPGEPVADRADEGATPSHLAGILETARAAVERAGGTLDDHGTIAGGAGPIRLEVTMPLEPA